MINKKITLLCFIALFSANLSAMPQEFEFMASETRNGGDALVCLKDGVQTTQLLDFWEAKTKGFPLNLDSNTLTHLEKAKYAIKQLENLDPVRAELYTERLDSFANDSIEIEDFVLLDVNDSDHDGIPNQCQLEQLATRRNPLTRFEKSFLINQDLWNQLDNNHKAGLLLHEVIYEEFFKHGEKNSRKARLFNSYLAAGYIGQMTFSEYIQLLQMFNIKDLTIIKNKMILKVSTIKFDINNKIIEAVCLKNSILNQRIINKDMLVQFTDHLVPINVQPNDSGVDIDSFNLVEASNGDQVITTQNLSITSLNPIRAGQQISANDAEKFCENLTFAQKSNWRLPTVAEGKFLTNANIGALPQFSSEFFVKETGAEFILAYENVRQICKAYGPFYELSCTLSGGIHFRLFNTLNELNQKITNYKSNPHITARVYLSNGLFAENNMSNVLCVSANN